MTTDTVWCCADQDIDKETCVMSLRRVYRIETKEYKLILSPGQVFNVIFNIGHASVTMRVFNDHLNVWHIEQYLRDECTPWHYVISMTRALLVRRCAILSKLRGSVRSPISSPPGINRWWRTVDILIFRSNYVLAIKGIAVNQYTYSIYRLLLVSVWFA